MYERTLTGFQILVKKFNPFVIKEEMIFIDNEGKVTVWIHPNLSIHSPLENYTETKNTNKNKYKYSSITQAQMVFKLIRLIEENVDLDEYTEKNISLFS